MPAQDKNVIMLGLYIKLAMHSVHASSSQLVKSFEVESSHAAVKSSQVKSNVIKSTVVDLGSFYPQVGSRFCTAATRRSNHKLSGTLQGAVTTHDVSAWPTQPCGGR